MDRSDQIPGFFFGRYNDTFPPVYGYFAAGDEELHWWLPSTSNLSLITGIDGIKYGFKYGIKYGIIKCINYGIYRWCYINT